LSDNLVQFVKALKVNRKAINHDYENDKISINGRKQQYT
jgi:hypothetical protein